MQHFYDDHAHIDDDNGDDDNDAHIDDDDNGGGKNNDCCQVRICTVAWDSLRPMDDKGVDVVKLKKDSLFSVDVA